MAMTEPLATPRPIAAPTVIWATRIGTRLAIVVPGSMSSSTKAMVRNAAIGSLLPDSSSRRGRNRPRSPTLRERSTANTAAASVEEMIAPRRSPVVSDTSSTTLAMVPATIAVTRTPKVARITP